GPGGTSLSKRDGAQAVRDFRAEGVEAGPLCAMLASLGTAEAADPSASLTQLVAAFDIHHFGRAQPQFDPVELTTLSSRYLHGLGFDAARPHLVDMGIDEVDEAFWLAVRSNLTRFADALTWWKVIHDPLMPLIEDEEVCAAAAACLPPEPWGDATWSEVSAAVKAATGRKGRALFHPLRLALTGRENGPELKALLPMIGRARAFARLSGQAA
ncbi:MAG: glutamate--tRNA ligase, partial [Rhodospirillaceae bacterium]|nr:glutamate--tRNA ligase [Rhodospirillaceae bacterium]